MASAAPACAILFSAPAGTCASISLPLRIRENLGRRTVPQTVLFAAFAALLGTLDAGLLIGWHQINPGQVAWLRKDPAVYQAGWEFLRRAPWSFPPTWLPHLDFPFGISASYLDVIPLVAVPIKLVSPLLANHFQYLGLYVVLCLVLQTWFAFRLMTRFTTDKAVIFLGVLFFLNSPILLMRLYGHFSLCSQWLILAALYYYFAPTRSAEAPSELWPFLLLLALSGGTSPYLSLMVLGIALPGSMPAISGGGYGAYSMNLLAPINPSGSSIIFRSFAVLPLQTYEGYNYLGAGIIALGVLCVARDPALLGNLWGYRLRPLVVMSLFFFMAALSARVAVGQKVIVTIPLPSSALDLLAVFRSSGRLFWPVHELLTLGALVGTLLTQRAPWAARTVLVAALCLQVFDVLPIRESVAHESSLFERTPLHARDWWMLAKSNRHLIVLPARQCDAARTPGGDPTWPWFAGVAAKTGMTLNSVHAARLSVPSDDYNCKRLPLDVAQGKLQSDTAYVFDDRLALLAIMRNHTHFCRRVDDFNLCTFDLVQTNRSRALADWIVRNGVGR
jgi:hypothetical protein